MSYLVILITNKIEYSNNYQIVASKTTTIISTVLISIIMAFHQGKPASPNHIIVNLRK